MQILQRSFSILLTIFFLLFAITLVFEEKGKNGYEQWKEIQINRFLEQVSKEGSCSYKDYQLLHKALNKFGNNVKIEIKEYQKERDMKGNVYWYLISWEEIKECFLQKEHYTFQKNSVIELYVTIKKGNIEKQNKYYSLSKEKVAVNYVK